MSILPKPDRDDELGRVCAAVAAAVFVGTFVACAVYSLWKRFG